MAHLSMWFLGGFRASLDGEPVRGLEYDKVRALLAYLSLEPDRPHRRESLAGLLWPELPERRARRNLSQALFGLRHALQEEGGEGTGPPHLLVSTQSIQFDAESDHWLDVRAFLSLLSACREHAHWRLETCPACVARLEEGAALYRGPFLEGLSIGDSAAFEEWQLLCRERLHALASDALGTLAASAEARGAYEEAVSHALRWLELDPWHEGAHRALMRALAQSGRRSAALAQYERCRRTLAEELGIEPAEGTEQLYRAIRDGAALDRTVRPLPNNLPAPVTPLVGRREELEQLTALLQDPTRRLVTLVGPGGIGKTRLALQVASQVVAQAPPDRFRHGVYLAALASVPSADALLPAVAGAIGYTFREGVDPRQQLLRHLRDRDVLLVLDNFEHLLDGASGSGGAGLILDILQRAPGVRVLVTSRARLNVYGEQIVHLAGLPYPRQATPGREDLCRYDAVRLFVEMARSVQPGAAQTGEDLAHVARICRLVEGMPLGILLAAAWSEILSPAEIETHLGEGLDFLAADLRDLPPRQRSMHAVFDSAWRLLTEVERATFARLSVFRGGFTAEASQAVAGADLATLRGLLGKSFLARDATGRYQVHELLRQYADGKLATMPGERERARDLHCAYYVQFLARWDAKTSPGEARDAWSEVENIRATWNWAVERRQVADVRQMLWGIDELFRAAIWFSERCALFGSAVELLRTAEPTRENQLALGLALCLYARECSRAGRNEEASVLAQEGATLLRRLGARRELAVADQTVVVIGMVKDDAKAEQLLQERLEIACEVGDEKQIFQTHYQLGRRATQRGAYEDAETHLRQAFDVARNMGHCREVAAALGGLGGLAYGRGEDARAKSLFEESLALFRQVGDTVYVAFRLSNLGGVALAMGDVPEARARYEECLEQAQELDDPVMVVEPLLGLGDVTLATGEMAQAKAYYRQALETLQRERGVAMVQDTVTSLARLSAHQGRPERAVELLALLLANLSGYWGRVTSARRLLEELRAELPADVFSAAQERGRARDLRATAEKLLAELEG
jgi:predicted ATPase/DNA-binding SARP family transcriptional activator